MQETTLRQVQLVQKAMLDDVVAVCNAHGLAYFLINGTLLGAVRHKGFIPWDDDLDIGLKRDAYEQLIPLLAEHLPPEKYFVQDMHMDSNYGLPYAKVLLNNTIYAEAVAPARCHSGVFIDIFPIDHYDPKLSPAVFFKMYLLKRLVLARCGYHVSRGRGIVTRLVYGLLHGLSLPCTRPFLMRRLEGLMQRCRETGAYAIFALPSLRTKKSVQVLPAALLDSPATVEFEGTQYTAFSDPDAYLTAKYGDYMNPVRSGGELGPHSVVNVDLGTYA